MDYSEAVLRHFEAPRNSGAFPAGTPGIVSGQAGARKRGREIHLELKLSADGRIEACRYQAYGCPATIALCSVLSERLPGMSVQEAQAIVGLKLAEELELPAAKRDAALLLEDALKDALQSYNRNRQKEAI
ncbi:MAG: iron-sulfur cluster assembly scaffold protein [Bacillota bacterium]